MSIETVFQDLTKALLDHAAALNQLARANEMLAEALRSSHKADELAKVAAAKEQPKEETVDAEEQPKDEAKAAKKTAKAKAAKKAAKAAKKTAKDAEVAAEKDAAEEKETGEPLRVAAMSELSDMLSRAREAGEAAYRQFFRAAKSVIEAEGVDRFQAVPESRIPAVLDSLREAFREAVGSAGNDGDGEEDIL